MLVPLDLPGITVRPIAQLDGETGFAEVFFDDARVPCEIPARRGGQGLERRDGDGRLRARPDAAQPGALPEHGAHAWWSSTARLRRAAIEIDPSLRDAVARSWMDAEAYALNTYQTVSRLLAGGSIGAEASLNKIFWSELDVHMHETALALLGARGELLPEAPAAQGVGSWLDGYLFSLSGPIYAGTNEIQRNVIAERILGLPRK